MAILRRLTLLFVTVLSLGGLASPGYGVDLPTELPLVARSVVVELWNAELSVLVSSAYEPTLRATTAEQGAAASGRIEVLSEGGVLTVRRVGEASGDSALTPSGVARLRVDMWVDPTQQVDIRGTDLVVDVEFQPDTGSSDETDTESSDETDTESGDETAPPADAGVGMRLSIESSEVRLAGLGSAVVEAVASSLWLDGTRGSVTLMLWGGSAQVEGHQGFLALTSVDAEVVVSDLGGELAPDVRGGSLVIRGGAGDCNGQAAEAFLLFESWRGKLILNGTDTTLEVRSVEAPFPWRLEGDNLRVALEDVKARLITAQLEGGSFEARSIEGSVKVGASRQTAVELTDFAGNAELTLADGAEARLARISGVLIAQVDDGSLWVDGVRDLRLSGARSQVVAGGVERLSSLELTDSELTLDLTMDRHDSSLKLMGVSRAEIQLSAPCVVRIDAPGASMGSQVEVSGCEVRLPGQPDISRPRRIYGARTPVRLKLEVSEETTVEVEGKP